jgi:hypothetical protein
MIDALAPDGVGLHDCPLLIVERGRFLEDKVWNANLADVVQAGSKPKQA